jgi:hypothetical protein
MIGSKKTFLFFHFLLDKYLKSWILTHPNDEPFVSIKIFKYDKNKMNHKIIEESGKQMEKDKDEYKLNPEQINDKKRKRKRRIINQQEQITTTTKRKDGGVVVNKEITNKPQKIIEEEEYITDLDLDELKYNIESHDRTVDTTMNILNIRNSPIIQRTTSMLMPRDVYLEVNQPIENMDQVISAVDSSIPISIRPLTDTELLINEINLKNLLDAEEIPETLDINGDESSMMIKSISDPIDDVSDIFYNIDTFLENINNIRFVKLQLCKFKVRTLISIILELSKVIRRYKITEMTKKVLDARYTMTDTNRNINNDVENDNMDEYLGQIHDYDDDYFG